MSCLKSVCLKYVCLKSVLSKICPSKKRRGPGAGVNFLNIQRKIRSEKNPPENGHSPNHPTIHFIFIKLSYLFSLSLDQDFQRALNCVGAHKIYIVAILV